MKMFVLCLQAAARRLGRYAPMEVAMGSKATMLGVATFASIFATASLSASQIPGDRQATGLATDSPIVVTGTRLTPEEARARAIEFVRGTGIASGERPVARWVDPVCIEVIGLSDRHAGVVKSRLERIAGVAGIPVARGRCQNNLAVVFTGDGGAVVREVERRAPRRLEEVRGETRTRLLESGIPIRWWYTTQPRSRHGIRDSTNEPGWAAGAEDSPAAGGGSILPASVPNLYHYNSSIVSTQAVRALVSASVVVDVNALREPLPLDAIAAYVAMVAFAEMRENDFSTPVSILGMFEDSPTAPRGLTDWDLAFLRALYRLPLDRGARLHRGIMVQEILAAVEAGG